MNHFAEIAIVGGITFVALAYLLRKAFQRFRPGGKACGRCGCGCELTKPAGQKPAGEVKPATLTIGGREVV
ncbi:MAG: hypothetical protein WD768_16920 [Phycisphaeraceae bacterium]